MPVEFKFSWVVCGCIAVVLMGKSCKLNEIVWIKFFCEIKINFLCFRREYVIVIVSSKIELLLETYLINWTTIWISSLLKRAQKSLVSLYFFDLSIQVIQHGRNLNPFISFHTISSRFFMPYHELHLQNGWALWQLSLCSYQRRNSNRQTVLHIYVFSS